MQMVSVDRKMCSLEHELSDMIPYFVQKRDIVKTYFYRRYFTKFVRPFTITKVTRFPCVIDVKRQRPKPITRAASAVLSCKAPVTPNGDATAFVQRSENLSARCGVAAKHA